jgi:hypothetical protein
LKLVGQLSSQENNSVSGEQQAIGRARNAGKAGQARKVKRGQVLILDIIEIGVI